MEKILYIDCFSGISGDMMVGAFIDLAEDELNISFMQKELKKAGLEGYEIEALKEKRGPVYATKFNVVVEPGQPLRDFGKIRALINNSSLNEEVKKTSIDIFTEIARAEAGVHKMPMDKVHFHEVGAVDSIIDIICTSLALNKLKIKKIYSSKVPLGSGIAESMHGKIPVPAPATLEILKGLPVYGGDFDFEVTTPTGAAILKVLSEHFCEIPDIIIEKTGFGAGSKMGLDKNKTPNVLRLLLGRGNQDCSRSGYGVEASPKGASSENTCLLENVLLLSTNIDDITPEIMGYALDRFFNCKALDAWAEPLYMKKNRPAYKLCALVKQNNLKEALEVFFRETGTLGVRAEAIKRYVLKRKIKTVQLPYGSAKIKVGLMDGKAVNYSPEYESCADLAKRTGRPLKEIYSDLLVFLSSK